MNGHAKWHTMKLSKKTKNSPCLTARRAKNLNIKNITKMTKYVLVTTLIHSLTNNITLKNSCIPPRA